MLYVTTKNENEARTIAHTLLEDRLIACGNIVPAIQSIYRWQGKTIEDGESLLILKTKKQMVARVTARIKEIHSYECPCIVELPITGGNPPFINWVSESCEAT